MSARMKAQRLSGPKDYYRYTQLASNQILLWGKARTIPGLNHIPGLKREPRIVVFDNHLPVAIPPTYIPPAWAHGRSFGEHPKDIDASGRIFIDGGKTFSPQKASGAENYPKGDILGLVVEYDVNQKSGTRKVGVSPQIKSLGCYRWWDQVSHVTSTIEIAPIEGKPSKLKVVEARMETNGLREDQSKYVYNFTPEGQKRLKTFGIEQRHIQEIRINPQTREAEISYTLPGRTQQTLIMSGRYFVDNLGKPLLANRKAGMSTFDDFYQAEYYTDETARYRPVIDRYPADHGELRLILHKTSTYEIDTPATLVGTLSPNHKIFPSTADAAAEIDGEWLPLSRSEPLTHIERIDLGLSRVQNLIFTSISVQSRTGNMGEMSAAYPRDAYFYGLQIFNGLTRILRWGANIAINRGKGTRAMYGIESGRTHTMHSSALYDEMAADAMETNAPHATKFSNHGHHVGGPGVSEDTQMELLSRLRGERMWITKRMMAILPAEKRWGKYFTQNALRYILSETLFIFPFRLAMNDLIMARHLRRDPVFMKWGEISETAAGRTWYKVAFAKLGELAAVPFFLATGGHILFFPVDLTYFIVAWTARTIFPSANYILQMFTLGYGFMTGFLINPAYELTFLYGYLKAGVGQFLDRAQYAIFALTVGGGEAGGAKEATTATKVMIGVQATALATAIAFIALGGFSQLALPLGLAIIVNMIFGSYQLATKLLAWAIMRKETKKDVAQKSLDEWTKNKPQDHQALKQVVDSMWLNTTSLSYQDLFAHKATLKGIVDNLALEQIDSTAKKPFKGGLKLARRAQAWLLKSSPGRKALDWLG
ncbi:MAG: hypothetical protein HQ596_00500, partial [Candidatus Saganbacteria bacterium]|nr:hypothetical protein [Candidatus Saganbacteria bacterium]